MADYIVQLSVRIYDIDEEHYFHDEPMDYLLESGVIENAEVEHITEF